MLYIVVQLEEMVKVYIDQEFNKMDKELNSLQRKVQELTNHVAVLPKKMIRSVRTPMMVVRLKCHSILVQILIRFKPTAPDQGLKDVTRLRNLLHYSNTKLWDKLTGGEDSCFYAKDLVKHPRIYNYVMKELQDYITHVQQIHPKLKHVKGGAILSAPNSPAQINGHYGKNHSDNTANVLECPPDERPLLIIVAVDLFGLQYLPSQEMKRKDIERLHVNQGKMVMFTNTCLHSDITNKSDEYRLRYFAYLVSHDKDFPKI
jgi:hypothetical protein